jgi:F0F1-type ATP synthase assembly protein I
MTNAAHALSHDVRRMFSAQAVVVALCAACFALVEVRAVLAVLYGGGIALIANWLAYRAVSRASEAAPAALYGGLTLRLAAVIGLFAVAFGLLEMHPLPILAGFVAAQFACGACQFIR